VRTLLLFYNQHSRLSFLMQLSLSRSLFITGYKSDRSAVFTPICINRDMINSTYGSNNVHLQNLIRLKSNKMQISRCNYTPLGFVLQTLHCDFMQQRWHQSLIFYQTPPHRLTRIIT
jgi:hypothetical protein